MTGVTRSAREAVWSTSELEPDRRRTPGTTGTGEPGTVSGLTTPVLISYLTRRYHDALRNLFPKLIAAARIVERLHSDHPDCPRGLANLLSVLSDELSDHIDKEQDDLFPSMLHSPGHNLRFPIDRRRAEHEDFADQLDTLHRLTNGFVAPDHGGSEWRMLYDTCRRLNNDLRLHIHFEDDVLFPRFEAAAS